MHPASTVSACCRSGPAASPHAGPAARQASRCDRLLGAHAGGLAAAPAYAEGAALLGAAPSAGCPIHWPASKEPDRVKDQGLGKAVSHNQSASFLNQCSNHSDAPRTAGTEQHVSTGARQCSGTHSRAMSQGPRAPLAGRCQQRAVVQAPRLARRPLPQSAGRLPLALLLNPHDLVRCDGPSAGALPLLLHAATDDSDPQHNAMQSSC